MAKKQNGSHEALDFEDTEDKDAENTSMAEATDKNDTAAEPDETSPQKDESASESPAAFTSSQTNKAHRFKRWFLAHKKFTIPGAVVVVLALLVALPWTRYPLAGLVWRQDFKVLVTDQQTHKPVTGARVTAAGVSATTDNKGRARVHTRAGRTTLVVTKKYYKSASESVMVPILKPKSTQHVNLQATGRLVPIKVVNKINGQPLANALVKASGSDARTDAKGEAVIVVPPTKSTMPATITASGYNQRSVSVVVTADSLPANVFQLTPAGKLYFLSNLSGNIDVVKTDLDGQHRQTVLPGTGKENKYSTVLLASTDWKYLALQSSRDDSQKPKLYLIDTSNDSLTTMDEGDAGFTPIGWSGHQFVYRVDRNGYALWKPKAQALKSFDAAAKKINVLDETLASGDQSKYSYERFENSAIIGNQLVYAKNVYGGGFSFADANAEVHSHPATLNTIQTDGSNKKTVKAFPLDPSQTGTGNSIQLRLSEPQSVYVQYASGTKEQFYEYEDGQISDAPNMTDAQFYSGDYPTYLQSPADDKTFWALARDGKNALFVGDKNGKNGKQVATLSDYQPYGWFTNDYLLVSKNGSELYILPLSGANPQKISDYYKPSVVFRGYGGGYGGL